MDNNAIQKLTSNLSLVSRASIDSESQVVAALQAVHSLFNRSESIHRAARQLIESGSLTGEAEDMVKETLEDWTLLRERVAECGAILASMHNGGNVSVVYERHFADAARSGALAKRLAEWEKNYVREAVVTALAMDGSVTSD